MESSITATKKAWQKPERRLYDWPGHAGGWFQMIDVSLVHLNWIGVDMKIFVGQHLRNQRPQQLNQGALTSLTPARQKPANSDTLLTSLTLLLLLFLIWRWSVPYEISLTITCVYLNTTWYINCLVKKDNRPLEWLFSVMSTHLISMGSSYCW